MTAVEQQRVESVRDAGYVGGLDGLRAIAVVAVIAYHFSKGLLPAGFLGVDVFFVVSGFLIARLVVREAARTGTVSLGNFWSRRARRLLPALGVVTLASLVACALFFTKTDLFGIRAQALGTLFYCANWVMIAQHNSYFATIGRRSPFEHMWTLAVEEQFYVVLPLVCFAARRWIVRFPVRAALVALGASVASTAWMWVLVKPLGDPSRAYLGSDSHAMGLCVGVAVGILAATGAWERVRTRVQSRAATVVAMLALAGVILTMRFAGDYSLRLYHGGFLLFSLACAVVIAVVAGAPGSTLSWVLSRPWLVAVGLRSYSLYIWHWPVVVFVEPHAGFGGVRLFVVRAIWSVGLAEVSFRLIERPFRFGAVAQRTGSRGAIALYTLTALVCIGLVLTVDAPGKSSPTNLTGSSGGDPGAIRVDLFGDSTGLVFGLAGQQHRRSLHLSAGGDARLGCGLVVTDHMVNGRVSKTLPDCFAWKNRWLAVLHRDRRARIAVMAGAWDVLDHRLPDGHVVKFGTQEWTDLVASSVRDAFATLTSTGQPVYVFEVPCYGSGDPNAPIPERGDQARIDAMNAIYEKEAAAMPLVRIVHWRSLVCPDGRRRETLNGKRLWDADEVHLTSAGAVEVWKWWLAQLRASS